jgi:metal-responsive CopG/Arc/MetJ family transcriptional regulator
MSTVRTAISMQESTFRKADRLARRMKISRSRFFARAAEEFIRRHQGRELLENLNKVYGQGPDEDEKAILERTRSLERRRVKGTW